MHNIHSCTKPSEANWLACGQSHRQKENTDPVSLILKKREKNMKKKSHLHHRKKKG